MAKTKTVFFVISCSADGLNLDIRFLYVHGEGTSGLLPTTIKEAKRRIYDCYGKQKCTVCDAEIHKCNIVREKQTVKQGYVRNENKLGLQFEKGDAVYQDEKGKLIVK